MMSAIGYEEASNNDKNIIVTAGDDDADSTRSFGF